MEKRRNFFYIFCKTLRRRRGMSKKKRDRNILRTMSIIQAFTFVFNTNTSAYKRKYTIYVSTHYHSQRVISCSNWESLVVNSLFLGQNHGLLFQFIRLTIIIMMKYCSLLEQNLVIVMTTLNDNIVFVFPPEVH